MRSVVAGDEVWGEWYFHDEDGPAERGVVVLVIDHERDLIVGSRFYLDVVR